jgi:antitoxin (DNA-binding transcriptional repressor) of toxin-antitoxin stability system
MAPKGETIMSRVTIQEAQARLQDLIRQLAPGDELLIIENDEPVARLARTETKKQCLHEARTPKTQTGAQVDVPREGFQTADEWIAAWRAWVQSHAPRDFVADDSRESICEGRGE